MEKACGGCPHLLLPVPGVSGLGVSGLWKTSGCGLRGKSHPLEIGRTAVESRATGTPHALTPGIACCPRWLSWETEPRELQEIKDVLMMDISPGDTFGSRLRLWCSELTFIQSSTGIASRALHRPGKHLLLSCIPPNLPL
ncbi:uncharacterized protein LOC102922300 [Peromyscus maniculatus bairdii]|uniref:uncharacterized protein LOC102922300 n=1 Tax=Peromyscus maniculatus bairdii TaxID=230844 RepID=UPI003FCFCFF0